jgi:hypothetical protein
MRRVLAARAFLPSREYFKGPLRQQDTEQDRVLARGLRDESRNFATKSGKCRLIGTQNVVCAVELHEPGAANTGREFATGVEWNNRIVSGMED